MLPIPFTRDLLVLPDASTLRCSVDAVLPFLWTARLGAPESSGFTPAAEAVCAPPPVSVTEHEAGKDAILFAREWAVRSEVPDASMCCSPLLDRPVAASGTGVSALADFPRCRRPWGGIRPGMPSANSKTSLQSVPCGFPGGKRRPSHLNGRTAKRLALGSLHLPLWPGGAPVGCVFETLRTKTLGQQFAMHSLDILRTRTWLGVLFFVGNDSTAVVRCIVLQLVSEYTGSGTAFRGILRFP